MGALTSDEKSEKIITAFNEMNVDRVIVLAKHGPGNVPVIVIVFQHQNGTSHVYGKNKKKQ